MTQRRPPPAPAPPDAQKAASKELHQTGKVWITPVRPNGIVGGMNDPHATQVDMLLEWLLPAAKAAHALAPPRRGQPPKWDMMIRALEWLRATGCARDGGAVRLSDAPGSECVRVLTEFLSDWNGRPASAASAADLAARLMALVPT